MQSLPNRATTDESAAFAAFTQNLTQKPPSAIGALSAKSSAKRRSLAWPTLIGSSLVIGVCSAAGALVMRRYGLSDSLLIGAAAIIGGPFGACAVMAGAILGALRIPNRTLHDVAETGTYKDMPSMLVPLVWGAGYLGAIGGSAVFAGVAVHLATGSPDQQFLFKPPAIGGAVGAALCAMLVAGRWLSKLLLAPRAQDVVRER